jgi:hypothetical protein
MTNYNLNFTGAEIDEAVEKARAHLVPIDTSPTASSTKAVTSGGVKTYVDNSIPYIPQTALFHYVSSGVTTLNTNNSTFSQCPLTESYNFISGVSVSSNQITLPAGDYLIDAVANIAISNNNEDNGCINVIEKTDGTDLLRGMDVSTSNDFSTTSTRNTRLMGRLNLSESTTIQWMFRRFANNSNTYPVSIGRNEFGDSNVPHAFLNITKIA